MQEKLQIDSLDKKIIALLLTNARIPFVEVARRCKVSGAAIHQRVNQLLNSGILSGSQFNVQPRKMGYYTCAFIGIQVNLLTTKSHAEVFRKIRQITEVVECHHISGRYSLFIKVYARDNEHLKNIIVEKLQSIPEVTATETYVSLQEGFMRQLSLS